MRVQIVHSLFCSLDAFLTKVFQGKTTTSLSIQMLHTVKDYGTRLHSSRKENCKSETKDNFPTLR